MTERSDEPVGQHVSPETVQADAVDRREQDAVLKPMADADANGTLNEEPPAPAGRRARPQVDVGQVRTVAARVLWILSVIAALVLALAALMIATKARTENGFVDFVETFARGLDLGIFSLDNPIKEFTGTENAAAKTALLNYGLGAVFYLILGRILERVVRP